MIMRGPDLYVEMSKLPVEARAALYGEAAPPVREVFKTASWVRGQVLYWADLDSATSFDQGLESAGRDSEGVHTLPVVEIDGGHSLLDDRYHYPLSVFLKAADQDAFLNLSKKENGVFSAAGYDKEEVLMSFLNAERRLSLAPEVMTLHAFSSASAAGGPRRWVYIVKDLENSFSEFYRDVRFNGGAGAFRRDLLEGKHVRTDFSMCRLDKLNTLVSGNVAWALAENGEIEVQKEKPQLVLQEMARSELEGAGFSI